MLSTPSDADFELTVLPGRAQARLIQSTKKGAGYSGSSTV